MRNLGLIVIMLIVVGVTHCKNEDKRISKSLKIVTTIFPICDMVRNIAQDANVVYLLPPGVSPHSFEPSPGIIKKVDGSRLYILVGESFDNWAMKLMARDKENPAKTINLIDAIHHNPKTSGLLLNAHPNDFEHEHEHGSDQLGSWIDPHIWLDPIIAKEIVSIVLQELGRINPEKAEVYRENAKAYLTKLDKLHAKLDRELKLYRHEKYISFHGAFRYFSKRYGLVEAAVIVPFPGKEPSVPYIKRVIDIAKSLKVRGILAEPQISQKAADVLANEIKAKVLIVDPIGDPNIAEKSSYIRLMEYNLIQYKALLKESEQGL